MRVCVCVCVRVCVCGLSVCLSVCGRSMKQHTSIVYIACRRRHSTSSSKFIYLGSTAFEHVSIALTNSSVHCPTDIDIPQWHIVLTAIVCQIYHSACDISSNAGPTYIHGANNTTNTCDNNFQSLIPRVVTFRTTSHVTTVKDACLPAWDLSHWLWILKLVFVNILTACRWICHLLA